MNHTVNPHVMSQATTLLQDSPEKKGKGKKGGKRAGGSSGLGGTQQAHKGHHGVKSSGGGNKPFNADDAVNAAINLQVDMITDLSDITISMSELNSTIQGSGVSNSESEVEMLRALLSAQGRCCNASYFAAIVSGWASSGEPATAAGFKAFLESAGGDYYKQIFSGVFNNPNITSAAKNEFAADLKTWSSSCRGSLSAFMGMGSTLAQMLNQAATNVQNWQSIADSMKPTQLQQATSELIAEIGSESSMWGDVVSA